MATKSEKRVIILIIILTSAGIAAITIQNPAILQGYGAKLFNTVNRVTPPVSSIKCSKKEIAISKKQPITNQKIDYCTHFINQDGLKYNFNFESKPKPQLVILLTRTHGDKEYILETLNTKDTDFFVPDLIYAHETIKINSFNDSEIRITIDPTCKNDPNADCNNISLNNNYSNLEKIVNGLFTYYLDPNLFTSSQLKESFIQKMHSINVNDYDFLKNRFGFEPPIDSIIEFHNFTPNQHGAYEGGFTITSNWDKQVDQSLLDIFSSNTHELTHVFLTNINGKLIEMSWLEEGLADYMEDLNLYGDSKKWNFQCQNNGWQSGYYDGEQFYSNGPLVLYSDFTVEPSDNANFIDPLHRASYYRSAVCFWDHLEQNYGMESIKKITLALHKNRTAGHYAFKYLIKHIINPTLKVDLSGLVKERYNYSE